MNRDLVSRTEPESHPKLTNLFQTTSSGSRCSIVGLPYTYIMVLLNYMHYGIFISLSEAPGVITSDDRKVGKDNHQLGA